MKRPQRLPESEMQRTIKRVLADVGANAVVDTFENPNGWVCTWEVGKPDGRMLRGHSEGAKSRELAEKAAHDSALVAVMP